MSRRVTTVNNRIEFHHVMFNEDMTRGALGEYLILSHISCLSTYHLSLSGNNLAELTEHLNVRWNPLLKSHNIPARFLVLIDLKKCSDGKYRIWRYDTSSSSSFELYQSEK